MYARLWWKDLRQFWPIWVFLLLASLASQAIVIHYAGDDARSGALPPLALSFAWLYAVAVGAAAFAGERENKTLRFLDTLPVDRFLLWISKASFALVTTLVLAALMIIPAAVSTRSWVSTLSPSSYLLPVAYFVLLIEALGWGLLISALSRTALTAALGSAGCAAASLGVGGVLLDINAPSREVSLLVQSIPWRLLVIAAATAFSAMVMIRELGWNRSQVARRAASRGWSGGMQAAGRVWGVLRTPIAIRSPIARETSAAVAASPRIWARWPEVRSLTWLTWHQGRRLAALLLVVGVGIPILVNLLLSRSWIDAGVLVLGIGAVELVAGIHVFGAENRGRTHRFLAHHGARPGLVWVGKLLTWALALILIGGMVTPIALTFMGPPRASTDPMTLIVALAFWLYPFLVAVFCGMVIRRGITAWVVSLIFVVALVLPQAALVTENLISGYWSLFPPLGLLFLTWVWRRDWMLDRPAPGKWIRLGTWAAGTFAVLVGGYVAERAWGIPDPPALTPPAAWKSVTIPDDQNAAVLYRSIQRMTFRNVGDSRRTLNEAWGDAIPSYTEFLASNAEKYALVRKAAALPICRFVKDSDTHTAFDYTTYLPFDWYSQFVAIHAGELGRKGDLAGAWDDIEAVFRMAQQLTQDAISSQALAALTIEEGALSLAMQWAADPRQTPGSLRAALDAYRKLPAMTPAPDVVRAEATILEHTFDLPRDEFRGGLIQRSVGSNRSPSTWEALGIDAATTPWEIERARRVNRLRFGTMVQQASLDPSMRYAPALEQLNWGPYRNMQEARALYHLSPNTWYYVVQNDRNEVGRRALAQILALRIWQLEHGGKLPDILGDLVPGLLPKLPVDPFNKDQPFRYASSDGHEVPPIGLALSAWGMMAKLKVIPTQGYRLLYSVGLNQQDNGGTFRATAPNSSENDIIFPLKDDVGAGDRGPKNPAG